MARMAMAALLFIASTCLHGALLLAAALFRWLLPLPCLRRRLERWLPAIAESWIGVNGWMIDRFTRTRFIVEGGEGLRAEGRYLVLANHRSWVDIPVLQKVLNRRIPLLRFFLKRNLIWVPVLGLCWWALDFPFMRRYTPQQLARRPELAGRDLEETRKACLKFRQLPVSVMNFVEGTRFTPEKRQAGDAGYRHLLRPKAGGVAFVMGAMGDVLDAVLDVTLHYEPATPSLVDLFADRVRTVRVHLRLLSIPEGFAGADYTGDPQFRQRFQDWINVLWAEKDARLARWSAG
ncbi:acyltransferase [Arenimonas fontis]